MGEILFGPAGLGGAAEAEKNLRAYHKAGLRACEVAFTYSVYLKAADAVRIGALAAELGIELSIHAPYFVNLNSDKITTRAATKQRIMACCEVGELLGAKVVVFHPGYYGEDRVAAYTAIKKGIVEIMDELRKKKWKILVAPETMGKINVFGSLDEISRLVRETGCSFCIDYAHLLARDKKVDYAAVVKAFPAAEWHVHFSGIIYGDKGEKMHRVTEKNEWKELLSHLPRDKKIRIINESPEMVADSVNGLAIYKKLLSS